MAAVMDTPAAVMDIPAANMDTPAAVMDIPAAVMDIPAAVMDIQAAVMDIQAMAVTRLALAAVGRPRDIMMASTADARTPRLTERPIPTTLSISGTVIRPIAQASPADIETGMANTAATAAASDQLTKSISGVNLARAPSPGYPVFPLTI
jgi:hypothetical protein